MKPEYRDSQDSKPSSLFKAPMRRSGSGTSVAWTHIVVFIKSNIKGGTRAPRALLEFRHFEKVGRDRWARPGVRTFLAAATKSPPQMRGSVAQRHGGGLRDNPRLVIQAFRVEYALRHKTLDWRFPQRLVAPPRRRPRHRQPLLSRGGESKRPNSSGQHSWPCLPPGQDRQGCVSLRIVYGATQSRA